MQAVTSFIDNLTFAPFTMAEEMSLANQIPLPSAKKKPKPFSAATQVIHK